MGSVAKDRFKACLEILLWLHFECFACSLSNSKSIIFQEVGLRNYHLLKSGSAFLQSYILFKLSLEQ